MTDQVAGPTPGKSGDDSALTWLLVIIGMANLIGVSHGIRSREEILVDRPELTPTLLTVALVAGFLNVVSVVGLLRWRRWGAVGLVSGLLTVLAVNVWAGFPLALSSLSPVALLLLGLYLWPARGRLG